MKHKIEVTKELFDKTVTELPATRSLDYKYTCHCLLANAINQATGKKVQGLGYISGWFSDQTEFTNSPEATRIASRFDDDFQRITLREELPQTVDIYIKCTTKIYLP